MHTYKYIRTHIHAYIHTHTTYTHLVLILPIMREAKILTAAAHANPTVVEHFVVPLTAS